MVYKSYAKLNLFLDVVKLYKNKYHKIRSLFVQTDLFDLLEYEKNNIREIRVFDKSNKLPPENLLTKAAKVFIENYGKIKFGVDFYITKNIPIGGGMGGGSSNAAGVLKILNNLYGKKFGNKKLKQIGAKIGADVPFFIDGGLQKITGLGEINSKLKSEIKSLDLLLIMPDIGVPTPEAYKKIDENNLSKDLYINKKKYQNIVKGFAFGDFDLAVKNIYNKFEEVVFKEYPVLDKIKSDILESGALSGFMSGSGSTMAGIYKNHSDKQKAVINLKNKGYAVIENINIITK